MKEGEEYKNMQKHLLYISSLMIEGMKNLDKVRGLEAIWNELENTAYITFYYDGPMTEDELYGFAVINTEIIAHCADAMLDENFVRLDYPKKLPDSNFWAYKRNEMHNTTSL